MNRSRSGRILEQNSLFYDVHKVNKVKVDQLKFGMWLHTKEKMIDKT